MPGLIFRFTGGIPRVWHTNLSIQFMLVLLLVLEAAVNTRVDLTGILMGAVVIILAEVFRYGAYLQEEQDLTV